MIISLPEERLKNRSRKTMIEFTENKDCVNHRQNSIVKALWADSNRRKRHHKT